MEIKRDLYLQKLINKQGNGLVKIITGIRRCGKSYLLFKLFYDYLHGCGVDDGHIIKAELDSRDYIALRNPDSMLAYVKERVKGDGRYYVFLDEVQYMSEFEDVLNTLLHYDNVDVYVTGSNSKFLSTDVITEFRGRGDEIRLRPLSFSEYMSAYDGTKEDGFKDYSAYGGLPQILTFKTDEEKTDYLTTLFRTIYVRDIVDRYKIRNEDEFEELTGIVASSVGSLVNPVKISNTFKTVKRREISAPTVKKYLDYMQDAFMVTKVRRFDVKGRKFVNSLYKYYFEDPGIRNARLNFTLDDEPLVMENIVYNELCTRGFTVNVGLIEAFTKNPEAKTTRITYEVDFVANRGNRRYYIQSAYSVPSYGKRTQETNSLRNIPDSFKKIIIVGDNVKAGYSGDGFLVMNICDFLLDENSLER
ncbi:MAG: ATP-binding protein [Clostridia bacterium]|nr:ATP-binding protein [Clostridia bacterium]